MNDGSEKQSDVSQLIIMRKALRREGLTIVRYYCQATGTQKTDGQFSKKNARDGII